MINSPVPATIGLGKISDGLLDIEKAEKIRKISAIEAKCVREPGSEVLVDTVCIAHAAGVCSTLYHYTKVHLFPGV
jgi:hypothetical protein